MSKKYINCTNITYQLEIAETAIIDNFSATFNPGWTAFVGSNGTGKSTLLKLICGEYSIQAGTISSRLLCEYVDQQTDNKPEHLDEFIESYDSSAIRYKELLGIEYDWSFRWETLSSGEQKRAQIGTALYRNPDVLAVDEPTNHLDCDSASKVIAALQQFRGVGLIVTHDRALLDQLHHSTLLFMMNRITHYNCCWSDAISEIENEQNSHEEKALEVRKQIKKIKREEVKRRDASNHSKQRLSKGSLHCKDRDGRAKIDAARLSGKDSVDSRIAERLESRREHLEKGVAQTKFQKSYKSEMKLSSTRGHKKIVIDLPSATHAFDEHRSLSYDSLTVREGEKIAITGKNGTGKSTLLKKCIAEGVCETAQFLSIPQEISSEEGKRILREIRNMPSKERGSCFTMIKRLGSDPRRLLDSESPSPGEIRKLLLARAMQSELSLIIMDEPTNHLDLITVRSLESALQSFTGALLFVSHDDQFVKAIADKVIHLEENAEGNINCCEIS